MRTIQQLTICAFLQMLTAPCLATQHSALELAQAIADRPEGQALQQTLIMKLTNKHGQQRTRVATYYRQIQTNKRQTLVRFRRPARIRDTAFLTHEHTNSTRQDDQWMYLPALSKPRRISAAERGNYFFGTDFTYEDMKAATKFSLADYNFELITADQLTKHLVRSSLPPLAKTAPLDWPILQALPKTNSIAKELGYSRVVARVSPNSFMPRQVYYWDTNNRLLKQVSIDGVEQIQSIWTATKFQATNARSGHKTQLSFTDIAYTDRLQASLFSRQYLNNAR